MHTAPIALFAFKRPEHTRRTLQALARNPEFEHSALHIFCDGARRPEDEAAVRATRELARSWVHPHKTLHEARTNRGLAASIIGGVTQLCAMHGRVIVVEDDLTVAPVFLDFLNRALDRYADVSRVMQVSGHMFPVDLSANGSDAVLLPFTTSWGWATWQRAWECFDSTMQSFERVTNDRAELRRFDLDYAYPYSTMLKRQRAGKIDSWAIRWYLSVFARNGLALYPRSSLVSNEGFDGSGTHSSNSRAHAISDLPNRSVCVESRAVVTNEAAYRAVAMFMRTSRSPAKQMFDWYQRSFVR